MTLAPGHKMTRVIGFQVDQSADRRQLDDGKEGFRANQRRLLGNHETVRKTKATFCAGLRLHVTSSNSSNNFRLSFYERPE